MGKFDEELPCYRDWDWYLRVARSGAGMQREATPSAAIRTHPGNMSKPDSSAARRANLHRLAAKHGLPPPDLKNHASMPRRQQRE